MDGKPWFPVMGEFHYSRYPRKYWKESLYKMKAGGVDIVSTYAFWLHHEEIEGEYDFEGQRDLRKFTETVKECGLKMFLRIGPWCHGEARNGGFPDWLLQKDFEVRTNDERYFSQVKKYYTEISSQVKGLLHKDGGPIIGIQIENEYGHCGGLNEEAGELHMKRLTQMAKEAGLEVPLYTATGWGGAVTGGLLPVMGGYCEAPWEQSTEELPPNENYVFVKDRNDPGIGSDYGKIHGLTFDMTRFPYLTAELGGGLQVTHHRRPVACGKDIGAMSLTKLGSGVVLLGYYMYHGGTNPEGKLTTLQESRATGYPNDVPVLSYDFSAPVREYGQMSDTLNEIKLLAMFLKDFGSELCEMETVWEGEKEQQPEDLEALRTSVRRKGNQGYLFVNNYQRRYSMKEHLHETLKVQLEKETILFPPVDIHDGDYFFLPFHMPVGNGELRSALATPLCKMKRDGQWIYVFYTDTDPCYQWEKVSTDAKVVTISRNMALNLWKVGKEQEYLLITEDKIIESDLGYQLLLRKGGELKSYPALPMAPDGYEYAGQQGEFTCYKRTRPLPETGVYAQNHSCNLHAGSLLGTHSSVQWEELQKPGKGRFYELHIQYPEECEDCFLQLDFDGDQANLFLDGKLLADWFYTGKTWEIGMKRFGFPEKVELEILPLQESDPVFLETRPEFENGVACKLKKAEVQGEWNIPINLECV